MRKTRLNPLRTHKSYIAFVGHRFSGIALALFLPAHFILLGSALGGAQNLDKYLVLADLVVFKIAEWGLVVLLAIHFFFGVRVLMLEFVEWPTRTDARTGWIIPGAVAALFVGVIFILQI
ncbi:MAG: succinate dehydrogenase, cytochrome b556 subunit [Gammaproteobacteria bacterium]|nr:succinate dehydrogenase, cytochrome b556 subunit [Gammaproteobacteria bacterium]